MRSECNNPSKHRYDITMSKRTRKPLNLEDSYYNNPLKGEESYSTKVGEGKEEDRKSLKQLINGNEKSKVNTDEESRGKNSLGEHFTEEEKQLQLVKTQQQNSVEGVKLKGMVNRYVKVLSHLIKMKRDPRIGSRKKHVLQLTM
ncbi:Protein phosphatase Slingshot 1 like [Melia azedarach]|uniref:Protein phosphatase Slingshot 1 like n=1 Tax=Melia azedarach TaxID=155640 RepID=A0ACC1XLY3_MELAZ|nr:Protein phosphatase Slingshot 1 like [Melia azedarach]